MRTAGALLILAAVLSGLWTARPALADDPSGLTLVPLPPTNTAPGQESVILAAQVMSNTGPVGGLPVTFYVVTTVFGERLMKVGEALSDATGRASVIYRPTWEGDHTVVARFGGSLDYAETQTSFHFEATDPVSPYEPARFGLEPVRQWLPLAVGAAVIAVWASLGFALVSTVLGIRAANAGVVGVAGVAAKQPVPFPMTQIQRPAPMGRTLVAMALLLVLAALSATWFLRSARGPDEVSFSTEAPGFEHGGATHGDQSSGQDATVLPPAEPMPATLVRSVPTATFDEGGQPAPGSVAMPADVAITAGRVRVLDSTIGRIATMTSDGKLASILDSGRSGGVSLKGAPAMASVGQTLYVATQHEGQIVVVDSGGNVESVIKPVIPEGQTLLAPAGIAVTESGEIWLSDAANHRVLFLNQRGEFERVIGEGAASTAAQGFDTPGGLAIDEDGNLYVADTLNRVVKKFSPMGVHLQTIGEGRLALPSAVAVNEDGHVFVSDEAAHLVSVFGPGGSYLGSIGDGTLEAPHSVKVDGDLLYVMDRLAGLFVFRPDSDHASSP